MRRTLAFAGGLLVFLAACGDDSGTAAAGDGKASDEAAQDDPESTDGSGQRDAESDDESEPSDVDPCSLLAVSDLETEFGRWGDIRLLDMEAEFGDQGSDSEGDDNVTGEPPDNCGWIIGEFGRNNAGQVLLEDSGPGGVDELDVFRQVPDAVDIDGIGDGAVYSNRFEGQALLRLSFDGRIWTISVIVYDPDFDGAQAGLANLARKVVDRL